MFYLIKEGHAESEFVSFKHIDCACRRPCWSTDRQLCHFSYFCLNAGIFYLFQSLIGATLGVSTMPISKPPRPNLSLSSVRVQGKNIFVKILITILQPPQIP